MIKSAPKISDFLGAICFMLITYLSLAPRPEALSSELGDKFDHVLGYTVLSFLCCYGRRRDRSLLYGGLILVVYGGLIELVQPHFNRTGDGLDFVANASGCIIGVGITYLIRRLPRKSAGANDDPG